MDGGFVRVTRLHLTDVHPDPSLPWANGDVAVFAYLIDHPDGLILVDSGVGEGDELIDALYHPDHHDLAESIARAGHRIEDVSIPIEVLKSAPYNFRHPARPKQATAVTFI